MDGALSASFAPLEHPARGPRRAPRWSRAAVIGLLFGGLLFGAHPAMATEASADLRQLSLEELAGVEVSTASKVPASLWQVPAAVYVITGDDIRRSGATSLADALRLAPGVEVGQIDAGHWAVGIRGFGDQFSKSVLVLIDGRSVYTPLFAGVYWAVQGLVLDDIDRIEIIRGPGGTIWGANAVQGVINVITRARDTAGALQRSAPAARNALQHARYGAATRTGPTASRQYVRRAAERHQAMIRLRRLGAGGGFRADWLAADRSGKRAWRRFAGSLGQSAQARSLRRAAQLPPAFGALGRKPRGALAA